MEPLDSERTQNQLKFEHLRAEVTPALGQYALDGLVVVRLSPQLSNAIMTTRRRAQLGEYERAGTTS